METKHTNDKKEKQAPLPLDKFYDIKKHHLTLELDPLGCALTKGQCIYELHLHDEAESNIKEAISNLTE